MVRGQGLGDRGQGAGGRGKRGLAFIGGLGPAPEVCAALAAGADCVAAADSGLLLAEAAGIRPDIIAGDMDSLGDERRLLKYPPRQIFRFPRDKDLTDTEIVVDILAKRGCSRITLAGGGGGRLSHIFSILYLFERSPCYVKEWHTENAVLYLLEDALELSVNKSDIISVLPVGSAPWKAESKNLKWELNDVEWTRSFAAISNEPVKENVFFKATRGRFLVMVEGGSAHGDTGFTRQTLPASSPQRSLT